MKKPQLFYPCLLLFAGMFALSCTRGEVPPHHVAEHHHHAPAEIEWDEEFWQQLQSDSLFIELREIIDYRNYSRKRDIAAEEVGDDVEAFDARLAEIIRDEGDMVRAINDSLRAHYPGRYDHRYYRKMVGDLQNTPGPDTRGWPDEPIEIPEVVVTGGSMSGIMIHLKSIYDEGLRQCRGLAMGGYDPFGSILGNVVLHTGEKYSHQIYGLIVNTPMLWIDIYVLLPYAYSLNIHHQAHLYNDFVEAGFDVRQLASAFRDTYFDLLGQYGYGYGNRDYFGDYFGFNYEGYHYGVASIIGGDCGCNYFSDGGDCGYGDDGNPNPGGGWGGPGSDPPTDPDDDNDDEENCPQCGEPLSECACGLLTLTSSKTTVDLMEMFTLHLVGFTAIGTPTQGGDVSIVAISSTGERTQILSDYVTFDQIAMSLPITARIPGPVTYEATLSTIDKNYVATCTVHSDYPLVSDIINDPDVVQKMSEMWATTLAAAGRDANGVHYRQEFGTWIYLNTTTGEYEFDNNVLSGPRIEGDMGTHGSVALGSPSRSNETRAFTGALYAVAFFHTHTPSYYFTSPLISKVVGLSPDDKDAATEHNVPVIAYDYKATTFDNYTGRLAIPGQHPLNSDTEVYYTTNPNRRTLPF